MAIKRKYLSFTIALIVTMIILITMVGCKDTSNLPRGNSGAIKISSELIAETEGCRIYKVNTDNIPANRLYLTKCDFDKTSAVDHEYQLGKEQRQENNMTLNERAK